MKPKQFIPIAFALVVLVCLLAGHAADGPAYPANRKFPLAPRPANVSTNALVDRSYFGAPPPIRHFVHSQRDGSYCLQCHALKKRIAKRHQPIAPVPHAEYTQCLQCHAIGNDPKAGTFRDNDFKGLGYPGKGSRNHPLAPPTIPHQTFMRENCTSCHGPTGTFSIRTPHPFRSQCQQCHVPNASTDLTRFKKQ